MSPLKVMRERPGSKKSSSLGLRVSTKRRPTAKRNHPFSVTRRKHREQEDSGERMAAEPRDRGSSVDSNASDGSANPPGVLRCGTLEKPHGKK